MLTKQIEIINKLGLHARASSKLVQTAIQFKAEIFIERNGRKANAKSIMSLMMLAATKGSQVNLICDGSDEELALQQVSELFASRFGEAE
jgi:phosphocarrier protein